MSARLACPRCGHDDGLRSVERMIVHYPIRPAANRLGWEYTGEQSDVFDETAEHEGEFWCNRCDVQFTLTDGNPS